MSLPIRGLAVVAFLSLFAGLAIAEEFPADAKAILDNLDQETATIRKKGDEEIVALKKKTDESLQAAFEQHAEKLKALQEKYTKAGKLDEAVAIRDRLRTLKNGNIIVLGPGVSVSAYSDKIGETFLFEVTGASGGSIYGTDIYSYDSPLDTAAVHAGAIKFGERGIVRVTILPSKSKYDGTERNDVTSRSWGAYGNSYRVENATKKPAEKK